MGKSKFANEQEGRAVAVPDKPNLISELSNIINNRRIRNISWPKDMPRDQVEAAKWFRDRMEPMLPGEGAVLKRHKDKHEYWEYPYLERLKMLVKGFFRLKPVYQSIVLGACEEKIYWRGEDMNHFYEHEHSVYNEFQTYRGMNAKEKQQYRVNALAMAESLEPDVEF